MGNFCARLPRDAPVFTLKPCGNYEGTGVSRAVGGRIAPPCCGFGFFVPIICHNGPSNLRVVFDNGYLRLAQHPSLVLSAALAHVAEGMVLHFITKQCGRYAYQQFQLNDDGTISPTCNGMLVVGRNTGGADGHMHLVHRRAQRKVLHFDFPEAALGRLAALPAEVMTVRGVGLVAQAETAEEVVEAMRHVVGEVLRGGVLTQQDKALLTKTANVLRLRGLWPRESHVGHNAAHTTQSSCVPKHMHGAPPCAATTASGGEQGPSACKPRS